MFKKSLEYKLVCYCDADYAEDKPERKRTSGSCTFLIENLISRSRKRQGIIDLSIAIANTY